VFYKKGKISKKEQCIIEREPGLKRRRENPLRLEQLLGLFWKIPRS
jgi:hypothetical protein